MKTDILKKVEKDFGNDTQKTIDEIHLLDERSKGMIGDRILRAMVFLAKGDIDKFYQLIELGRTDYRDVLWQAEYDGGEVRLYDFNQTFHQLNLIEK